MGKALETEGVESSLERSGRGPGAQLREAREARRLELAEVAAALHIESRLLQALERDDFSRLPEPVFVRGYLRNYARLLHVPEQPLLDAYQRSGVADTAPLTVRGPISNQVRSGDRPVRWVTYVIVLGLLALLVVWSRNQSLLPERAYSPSADTEEREAASAQPAIAEAAQAPQAAPEVDVAQTKASVANDQMDGAFASQTGAAAQSPEDLAQTQPSSAMPRTPEKTALSTAQVAAAPEATAGAQAEPAEAAAPDTLSLAFSANCWTEVRDATGKRLIYDLVKSGTEREVSGQAPFEMVLGDNNAVRIQLNGESFKQPHISDGSIARFQVGAR